MTLAQQPNTTTDGRVSETWWRGGDAPIDTAIIEPLLLVASQEVNFGLPGITKDATAFLTWMLVGGERRRANKRSLRINAYGVSQNTLCLALEPFYDFIDWANPEHFALIERATRPLNTALRYN